MTKQQALQVLAKEGIVEAHVHFSGGNDEGGPDSVTFVKADGSKEEAAWWGNDSIDSELLEALAQPIFNKYYSFAGDFYVHGSVVWDVTKGTVEMSGDESQYVPFSESF